MTHTLACIEIGGSGAQTVQLDLNPTTITPDAVSEGIDIPSDDSLIAIAVPGFVRDGQVKMASTLNWVDADPVEILDLPSNPALVCNDAEAAALGEWVLGAGDGAPILYVGLGTGIGAAMVADGKIKAGNLLAHGGGAYSEQRCLCGAIGCLETVAAGWALPTPLNQRLIHSVTRNLAKAIRDESRAEGCAVVVSGGMVDRNPTLLGTLARVLGDRSVVPSERPAGLKSAAAWGMRAVLLDGSL